MIGFLFGKLPAFGDFVARGLSAPMRGWWDRWCSEAILDARRRLGEDFDRHYRAMPPRRFHMAPPFGDAPWQAGCLWTSQDRAGRAFPFVLGVASGEAIGVVEAKAIGRRIVGLIEQSLDDPGALIAAAGRAAIDPEVEAYPVRAIDMRKTAWIAPRTESVEV